MIEQSKTLQRLAQAKAAPGVADDQRTVLEAAHAFKLGWAQLGQVLLQVQRAKSYRAWGFSDFKTYCNKQLGLRWATVEKLLRSTYYMERHEPRWLNQDEALQTEHPTPDLNAVNFLARGEEASALPGELRQDLHREVFEQGATGVKVGRMASAQLDDEARQALGLRPPSPSDPTCRTALSATRDVEKVVRGLKRVEAPGEVVSKATDLLDGVRNWQASLEASE